MYRGFTVAAVIYAMFLAGSAAIERAFQDGIVWPGTAAVATALFAGYAGVMVYRALNMTPDLVASLKVASNSRHHRAARAATSRGPGAAQKGKLSLS